MKTSSGYQALSQELNTTVESPLLLLNHVLGRPGIMAWISSQKGNTGQERRMQLLVFPSSRGKKKNLHGGCTAGYLDLLASWWDMVLPGSGVTFPHL